MRQRQETANGWKRHDRLQEHEVEESIGRFSIDRFASLRDRDYSTSLVHSMQA